MTKETKYYLTSLGFDHCSYYSFPRPNWTTKKLPVWARDPESPKTWIMCMLSVRKNKGLSSKVAYKLGIPYDELDSLIDQGLIERR